MKRAILLIFLLKFASALPLRAQQSDAPYNGLILRQIATMPRGGGYSASHLANLNLGSSVTVAAPGLNVAAPLAQQATARERLTWFF